MRNQVPERAFETPWRGRTFLELAGEVLAIADAGLRKRNCLSKGGETEQGFLQILKSGVEKGQSPADEILETYNGRWNQNITKIFDELSY